MYQGANKEIYINNYNGFRTGCSSGTPSASSSGTCAATYDVIADQGSGLGAQGAGASTTGNIYGIYDMNGGAWEYMMGNYNHYSGSTTRSYTAEEAQQLPGHSRETNNIGGPLNSGYTGMCGYDGKEWMTEMGGRSWPEDKYYDLYTTSSFTISCEGQACKGHALNEVTGWYDGSSSVLRSNVPWICRGSDYHQGIKSSVFSSANAYGNKGGNLSFRLVLTP